MTQRFPVLAAMMLAGSVSAPAVAAPDTPKVAVFPVTFLDTSNEVGDSSADHARRATLMAAAAVAELGKQGVAAATTSDADLHARCPTNDADCQTAFARSGGATAIAVTTVHKVSSLILNISARLVDPATNRTTWGRDLSFRADSDESWTRAGRFLATELHDGLVADGQK